MYLFNPKKIVPLFRLVTPRFSIALACFSLLQSCGGPRLASGTAIVPPAQTETQPLGQTSSAPPLNEQGNQKNKPINRSANANLEGMNPYRELFETMDLSAESKTEWSNILLNCKSAYECHYMALKFAEKSTSKPQSIYCIWKSNTDINAAALQDLFAATGSVVVKRQPVTKIDDCLKETIDSQVLSEQIQNGALFASAIW